MNLIQEITEAAGNAAAATEELNNCVVAGKDCSDALAALAAIIGKKRANTRLQHAKDAVAEKEERMKKVQESAWGKTNSSDVVVD